MRGVIFNRKVQHDPLTVEVSEILVTPNFCNKYNLTGFCSINPLTIKTAVWCSLNECINNADQFSLEFEYVIHARFLQGGDVLLLDNKPFILERRTLCYRNTYEKHTRFFSYSYRGKHLSGIP